MTDSETVRRGIAIAARREMARSQGVKNPEGWLLAKQRQLAEAIGDERPPTVVTAEGFADWLVEFLGLSIPAARPREWKCPRCNGNGWLEHPEPVEKYRYMASFATPCPICSRVRNDILQQHGVEL